MYIENLYFCISILEKSKLCTDGNVTHSLVSLPLSLNTVFRSLIPLIARVRIVCSAQSTYTHTGSASNKLRVRSFPGESIKASAHARMHHRALPRAAGLREVYIYAHYMVHVARNTLYVYSSYV